MSAVFYATAKLLGVVIVLAVGVLLGTWFCEMLERDGE